MIYITIDGPAGSGKSSVAKGLAKKLGFEHLDSGALYRAAALLWLRSSDDEKKLENFITKLSSTNFELKDGKIFLNGNPLGNEIRTPEVGKVVSKVAEIQEIRDVITRKTRELAQNKHVVVEGRDIGTVVLPDACVKIFLTASVQERARRRYEEYRSKGVNISFEEVIREIKLRDRIDSTREIAPLKAAKDAIIFNTNNFTLEEVIGKLKDLVLRKIKKC